MTSDITIREATAEEVDEILALWKAAGSGPSVTDTPKHLRMLTEQIPDLFLVAESDGRIVGSVIGGWDYWRGHIYRLAVHPNHRRLGLALAILQGTHPSGDAIQAIRPAHVRQHGEPGP